MHVLSVDPRRRTRGPSSSRPLVEEAGHRLDEWSFELGHAAAATARLVRRGARLRRRDARRPGRRVIPWLARGDALAAGAARRGTRRCSASASASQLLARAAGAWVGRLPDGPRSAGASVELTDAGAEDPVSRRAAARVRRRCSGTTTRYGLPEGAVELARSAACTQAFRLGDACWGVQFHPEVTAAAARRLDRRPERPAARPRPAARGDARADRPLERARALALRARSSPPPNGGGDPVDTRARRLPSARAAARRGGSTRARSRRSCARRSRRCAARASRAPSASRSGSTRRPPLLPARRRARGSRSGEQGVPAPSKSSPTSTRSGARDVPLARVARAAALARVLLRRPHVEDRQRSDRRAATRAPAASGTRAGSARARRLPHRLELDRPSSSSPGHAGDAAEQDRDARMPGELGHLRRRHRADAVAAVDEHEPLAARDPVPAQAQRDLLRELARRRPRRPPAAASRARAAASRGCGRACARSGRARRRRRGRRRRDAPRARPRRRRAAHSAATISASAAIAGRSLEPREPGRQRREAVELDAEHVARAQQPRHVRDVGEPVLGAAEPRPLARARVELAERGVERLGRAVLAAPEARSTGR